MSIDLLNNEKQVGNTLKVPSNIKPLTVASIGYSAEYRVTTDRLIDKIVHYQTI